MKAARLHAFGEAKEGLRVENLPDVRPAEGEIGVQMLAAAVNPADLNVIEGKYGELPFLPAVIGNEGAGRVSAVGPGVEGFAPGDWVLPLTPGCWTEYRVVSAAQAIRLPDGLDPAQAALLSVNPPTAWAMLDGFAALRPGDWIVQNAANSAVGRCVIQLARERGLRTVNVVRRSGLDGELRALGADVVVEENADLRDVIAGVCGGHRPRLGLNAVGGASALNVANALEDGGTLVTYGAMGRQPLKIPNGLLIFRSLNFRGFWLRRWKEAVSRQELTQVFRQLAEASRAGRLRQPIHKAFPLDQIHEALAEAVQERRSGKVILQLA